MKKGLFRILSTLTLVILMTTALTGAVLAADPTQVDVTWGGAGIVDGTVDTGDANANFHSGGSNHVGEFHATDSNDNPYNYGVDSNSFTLETAITGFGQASLNVERTDAKTSYGAAGQNSYTYVEIMNGSATLQNRSATNYASMKDCNYGWNANDHITVTGADSYYLERSMDSGNVNFAGLWAGGTGDADLDCMNAEASAGQVRLGEGCGCYTNADFNAVGIGTFNLYGLGNNGVTFNNISMTGSTSGAFNWLGSLDVSGLPTITATDTGFGAMLNIVADFVSNFSMPDFSTKAW